MLHGMLMDSTFRQTLHVCRPSLHFTHDVPSTYLSFSSASRLSRKWCSCRYWQINRITSRSSILWPDHLYTPAGAEHVGVGLWAGHQVVMWPLSNTVARRSEVTWLRPRMSGLDWVEEMSESAGTLSDAFAGAVERVVRLHQTQVYGEFCTTEEGHIRSSAHITATRVWLPNICSISWIQFGCPHKAMSWSKSWWWNLTSLTR